MSVHVLPKDGNAFPVGRAEPKARAKGKATRKVAHSRAQRRARRQEVVGSAFLGVVALSLMALSLTHLAHGITIVTGSPVWEAWALAIGIDLGFVGFEIRKITASETTLRKIGRALNYSIVGTLAGSAVLNGLAFGANATGYFMPLAVAFGLCIPALVYCCTRFGTASWLD
jgi:hypothetical protein